MPCRADDQVHILHRHGTKKDFVSNHESSCKARSSVEADLYGTDIWAKSFRAVSNCNLAFVCRFELQLDSDVFRNAKVCRPGVDEGLNFQRLKLGLAWIPKRDNGVNQPQGAAPQGILMLWQNCGKAKRLNSQ